MKLLNEQKSYEDVHRLISGNQSCISGPVTPFWEADISKKIDMLITEMNGLQKEFGEEAIGEIILERLSTYFGGNLHHSGGGMWIALFDCGLYYIALTDEYLALNVKPKDCLGIAPDCIHEIWSAEKDNKTLLCLYDFTDQNWREFEEKENIGKLIFGSVIVSKTRKANKAKHLYWPFYTPQEWIEALYDSGLISVEGVDFGEPECMKESDGEPLLTKWQARWMRSKFCECGRLMGSYEAFDDMAFALVSKLEKRKEVK